MSNYDYQNHLLLNSLQNSGKDFAFINPLSHKDISRIELHQHEGDAVVTLDGSIIRPDVIYLERMWRADCLIDIPETCTYPTLLRSKMQSFLADIRYAVEGMRWVPGKVEDVERGESKPNLMSIAHKCGLTVPQRTVNSFRDLTSEMSYRKVLGFPFIITNDLTNSEESAITLLNTPSTKPLDVGLDGVPWQWQDIINARAQIRCVVINDEIRCYKADIGQFQGKSFREAQDDDIDIKWSASSLPQSVSESLLNLCHRLNLSMCCPEFLLDENGQYIFIDLNPCGDWCGFIDKEEDALVAKLITSHL